MTSPMIPRHYTILAVVMFLYLCILVLPGESGCISRYTKSSLQINYEKQRFGEKEDHISSFMGTFLLGGKKILPWTALV